ELQFTGEALVIDAARLASPRQRARELRLAAEHRVRITDAPEELARVLGMQAEIELGRLPCSPAALAVERRIGAREPDLVDAPVRAFGHRDELEAAEVLAAQVEALGGNV